MRAALYVGNQTFRVEDRAVRDPGPGEVRIDVAVVGICGTDLHIKHGAMDGRVRTPTVIGHEMSGTVAAVGDGVGEFAPGDRVTVMPLDWCGDCAACRAGHRHVWTDGRWLLAHGDRHWVPDHWTPHDRRWRFNPGHWGR